MNYLILHLFLITAPRLRKTRGCVFLIQTEKIIGRNVEILGYRFQSFLIRLPESGFPTAYTALTYVEYFRKLCLRQPFSGAQLF